MGSVQVLAALGRRLNREAGAPALPSLFLFSDPERMPGLVAAARRLPPGSAVIYRHFGAPGRQHTAHALAALCRRRRLILLIAADPELAARVGADGVHWPEGRLPTARATPGLVTTAAHSASALARAYSMGADAAILSPVFAARSGRAPLGLFRAGQLARTAPLPVIALGGVNQDNARLLAGRGFSGIAAVGALA